MAEWVDTVRIRALDRGQRTVSGSVKRPQGQCSRVIAILISRYSTAVAQQGAKQGRMGRSRGGLTTKIHVCVDTDGMPVRIALTTGEAHDNRLVTELLSDLKSDAMLLADRGCNADWIRAFAGQHGAWANIPPKRNRKDPICFQPTSVPGAQFGGALLQQDQAMPAGRYPI